MACLAAAELIIRLVFPQAVTGFSARLFTVGERGLAFLRPHATGTHLSREFFTHIRANAQGYRDDEWTAPTFGKSKVLFLGDSFVFGWGVEQDQSFVSRLEAEGRWSLYNAGIPGDGFRQYEARAELHIPQLKPDLVVLCTYANDFTDLLYQELAEAKTVGILYRLKNAIGSLHLYRLGYRLLRQSKVFFWLAGNAGRKSKFIDELQLYAKQDGLLDRVWPAARDVLLKIKALCDSQNARLVIVCVTPSYIADRMIRSQLLNLTGMESKNLDFRMPIQQLETFCREIGVSFVDPTARLQAEQAAGKNIYFPFDQHLNSEGHRVMAEVLAQVLLGETQPGREVIEK